MARVEVVDDVLWTKRVHGAPDLKAALEALPPHATVMLRIAGAAGLFQKLAPDVRTGADMPGLKPLGLASRRWRALHREHRVEGGAIVDIELVANDDPSSVAPLTAPEDSWERASPVEREEAWEAILALRKAGWRSDGPYGPRDELYDREDR